MIGKLVHLIVGCCIIGSLDIFNGCICSDATGAGRLNSSTHRLLNSVMSGQFSDWMLDGWIVCK